MSLTFFKIRLARDFAAAPSEKCAMVDVSQVTWSAFFHAVFMTASGMRVLASMAPVRLEFEKRLPIALAVRG